MRGWIPRLCCSAAAWAAAPALARLLLDYGADPALENLAGMTAADIAQVNGLRDIAAMLT